MTTAVQNQPHLPAVSFGVPVGNPHAMGTLQTIFYKSAPFLSGFTTLVCLAYRTIYPIMLDLGIISLVTFILITLGKIYARFTRHEHTLSLPEPRLAQPSQVALGQWSINNDIIVCNRVDDTLAFKKRMIQSAKKSIEISFNFTGGRVFRETLALITEQMRSNPDLKVHLLMSSDMLEPQDKALLKNWQENFPQRAHYLITTRVFSLIPFPHAGENHVKLVVIDGKYFATGGSSMHQQLTRENAPSANEIDGSWSTLLHGSSRDSDIIGKGDLANLMRSEFFRLYRMMEYRTKGQDHFRHFATDGSQTTCPSIDASPQLIPQAISKFLVGGPEHVQGNPITSEIVKRIERTRSKISLATLIFNPDKKIAKALLAAKARNVNITGFFNGGNPAPSMTDRMLSAFTRYHYNLVDEAFEHKTENRLYHKKAMLFDETYSMVTNYNIGKKSAHCDYEVALFFKDPRVHAALKRGLEEDKTMANRYVDEALKKIQKSYWTRFKGFVATTACSNFFG